MQQASAKKARRPTAEIAHLTRVVAMAKPHSSFDTDEIKKAKEKMPSEQIQVILNDMTKEGLVFSSARSYCEDEEVAITFEYPERFLLYAKVRWCGPEIRNHKIFSEIDYKYKVIAEFVAFLPEEIDRLTGFFNKVVEHISSR